MCAIQPFLKQLGCLKRKLITQGYLSPRISHHKFTVYTIIVLPDVEYPFHRYATDFRRKPKSRLLAPPEFNPGVLVGSALFIVVCLCVILLLMLSRIPFLSTFLLLSGK